MEEPPPRALVGWKREETEHGIVMTMQLVDNSQSYREHRFHRVAIVLSDRQLRSLARDLTRACASRGMDLFARRPWWRFWR